MVDSLHVEALVRRKNRYFCGFIVSGELLKQRGRSEENSLGMTLSKAKSG
jgi:hypothetical protein